jgi:hypothetical protein
MPIDLFPPLMPRHVRLPPVFDYAATFRIYVLCAPKKARARGAMRTLPASAAHATMLRQARALPRLSLMLMFIGVC